MIIVVACCVSLFSYPALKWKCASIPRIRFDKEGHLFFEFALVIPDVRRSFVKGSTMCVDHIGAGEFTIHFSPGDRGPHLLSLA